MHTRETELSESPQIKPKPYATPKNANTKTGGEESATFQTRKVTKDTPTNI